FLVEKKLSKIFIESYIKFSKDDLLEEHISFFKCYRAYVSGKVYGFQSEMGLNEEEKEKFQEISEKYYTLAHNYAGRM
ncbi:MAG: AAA family ATPase, partial [Candidatus Hodarchaeales archaeon]